MNDKMNVGVNCECCGREMATALDGVTTANVCIKCRDVFAKLSRHEAPEPLAVLADRKGAGYMTMFYPWSHNQAGWCIRFLKMAFMFEGPTYAAAEAAARKFLEGLEDKGGKIC